MDATSFQNEIEALRREVLVLRDEKISLEGRLSFRATQVAELEAEAADRLLEVARLTLEKDRLQDRVHELESSLAPGTIRDVNLVRKQHVVDLAARMTAIADVVFEERHVLEILKRSHRLLNEVFLYGVDNNVGLEEIIEDEVSLYLLGWPANPLADEDVFGKKLKAAGIAAGMRDAGEQADEPSSPASEPSESVESRFGKLKPIGLDLQDYQELADEMSYQFGLVFEIEHVHEVLQRSRGLLADVLQWGVSDTVVRENILGEVYGYLFGEDHDHSYQDMAALMQGLKEAGIAKGMKPTQH